MGGLSNLRRENKDSGSPHDEQGVGSHDDESAGFPIGIQSSDPDFTPGPDDVAIHDMDTEEALAFVTRIIEEQDNPLKLAAGEVRTFFVLEESGEDAELDSNRKVNEIMVADIRSSSDIPWIGDFIRTLLHRLRERLHDLAIRFRDGLKNAKRTILIAGRAKDVGVARRMFQDAMRLAGLDLGWRGYSKLDAGAEHIAERMAEYGFSYRPADGTVDLVFETLSNVPDRHKTEITQVVIQHLVEDHQALRALMNDVNTSLRAERSFQKIEAHCAKYNISTTGLLHLLRTTQVGLRIDKKGEIRNTLEVHDRLLTDARASLATIKSAVQALAKEWLSLNGGSDGDKLLSCFSGVQPKEFGVSFLKPKPNVVSLHHPEPSPAP